MKKKSKESCCKNFFKGKKNVCNSGCSGCAYFLGFIGAAVYYISTATSFWGGVVGVVKALVWPAFLVFEVLKYFGM